MRHVWLALAILVVWTGEAGADRISCECPAQIALPDAAMALPNNAKAWRISEHGAVHYERHVPTAELMGVYVDALPADHAVTGELDTTPPPAPTDATVSLTALPAAEGSFAAATGFTYISTLSVFAGFDNHESIYETALVRIDIHDDFGIVSLVTTPSRRYLCEPGFFVSSRTLRVDVRAIDLAGNESAPFSTIVNVERAQQPERSCDRTAGAHGFGPDAIDDDSHHHGHGFALLFLFLMYPLGLIAWLVIVLVRRAAVRREPAEPISLLEAEEVTRRLLRWQVIWSALLLLATLAVVARVDDDFWILFAPWLFSAFGKLFLQRRALRLLDRPEADAARRGRWLVVTSLQSSALVRAADIDFVVAKKRAVPTSTAL